MKKVSVYFLVMFFLLIFTSFYLINLKDTEISNLNNKIHLSNIKISQLNDYNSKLSLLLDEINNSFIYLNKTYNDLLNNYNLLDSDYYSLKEDSDNLIEDILIYQNELKTSIEWFMSNSFLDNSSEQKNIKRKLDSNCIDVKKDSCDIKLGCFYLINSEKLDIEYKYDFEISNSTDKLQSISEFVENSGGDCEDYSLFYKAEYNYLLNQCEGKDVVLEGWKSASSEEEKVKKYWLNYQKSWYLDEVVRVEIKGERYPNIVCGDLYDKNKGEISGHCMIAFSKELINSVDDIEKLNNMSVIEPQDGSFFGRINEDIFLSNNESFYNNTIKNRINVVITNDDYYLFSLNDFKWNSYNKFYNILEEKKTFFLENN